VIPHYFKTEENHGYVGSMPDIYYGVDETSGAERKKFLAWYKRHKFEPFDNRRVLDAYCKDDVTVLRQTCRFFEREFLQIGNI